MGKKADALQAKLDAALDMAEMLEGGLNLAYGVMTPASKKKFLEKAHQDVARTVAPDQEG